MLQLIRDNLELIAAANVLLQCVAAAVHKYAPDSTADHVFGAVARFLPADIRGLTGKGS